MKKTIAFLLCMLLLLLAAAAFAEGEAAEFENAFGLFQHWMQNHTDYTTNPYPAYICGVWSTDGSEQNLTFALTKDEAGEAGKAEILALIADDSTATFTYASYSFAELLEVQLALSSHMNEETGVYSIGIYEMDNCVNIGINTDAPGSEAFMQECFERYLDRVRFEEGSGVFIVRDQLALGNGRGKLSPWLFAALLGVLLLGAALLLRQSRVRMAQTNAGQTAVSDAPQSLKQVEQAVREANIAPPPAVDAAVMDAINKQ